MKTDKPTIYVETKVSFTDEQIDDLLTGAFEGGSNYWYIIHNDATPFDGPACEAWRKSEKGILVTDMEDPDTYGGYLNRESVIKGLTLMAEKHPCHWKDLLEDNADAITSDVFLQLCLFGEVIFG